MAAPVRRLPGTLWGGLLLCLMVVSACGNQTPPEDYVARVGDAYLTQQELSEALADMPPRRDSAGARTQVIDRWVTNELLYQEAQRRNLRAVPDVRRRIEESERSVLIDALVSRVYEEDLDTPSAAEINAYYQRNRDRLRLREPFVRVRYLSTTAPDSAEAARRLLRDALRQDAADSLWPGIVQRFALDSEAALTLADTYYPERSLFAQYPALRDLMPRLGTGEVAPVIEADSLHHVLHLVDRAPAGTIPELAWIEDDVQRQLLIDARKQMYARHVQRLRNRALSRNALEAR
ncbi:MAG: peptidyl-prolyl cis-trans isomerase [Bacteroidetes bacterium]|jgi:hypothetical protein|nr:peptidyl-prolyl cis-trans isomerase [Bacteroidota bacterium]